MEGHEGTDPKGRPQLRLEQDTKEGTLAIRSPPSAQEKLEELGHFCVWGFFNSNPSILFFFIKLVLSIPIPSFFI